MNICERISCHDFIEIGEYVYFSNWFYNGLFKVEIKTGKTFFLGSFEGEKLFEKNIHWKMMLKNDKIYFFPRRGYHMHIYHVFDKKMQAVEIRKKDEKFFVIGEVMLEDDCIIFFSEQENYPIKKLKLNTLEVSQVKDMLPISEKCLPGYKNSSLASTIEKYHFIKYINYISWSRISNEKWYSFMPLGCHLLYYTERSNDLEVFPLTVINEEELREYLYKVKFEILKTSVLVELEDFKISSFIDAMNALNIFKLEQCKNKYIVGEKIWKIMGK